MKPIADMLADAGFRSVLELADALEHPAAGDDGRGAQDASHEERPDLAGVPADVCAYLARLEAERDEARRAARALEEQVRTLLAERNDERDRYRLRLSTLRNRTVKPAARLAIVGLADVLEDADRRGKAEPDGCTPVYAAAIAEQAGLEVRSVATLTTEIAALGLVEKETELHRKVVEEGGRTRSVLCSVSRYRPAGGTVTAMLRLATTVQGPERNHGGQRKPLPKRCPDHPDAPIGVRWSSACSVCGVVLDGGTLARPPVRCDAQDAPHEERAEELPDGDAQDAPAEGTPPLMEVSCMEAQDAPHSDGPVRGAAAIPPGALPLGEYDARWGAPPPLPLEDRQRPDPPATG